MILQIYIFLTNFAENLKLNHLHYTICYMFIIQNEMCYGFIIFYHSRKTYEEEFCIQLSSLNFKNLKCFKHL